ncbi:MAG: hypothetical protein DRH15_14860, partial [Deltaproteobacteria bacterium]
PEAYSQKIQAAAGAGDLPDLFGILGEKKIFASFIKGGYVENLTPYLEENDGEWKKRFIEIGLEFNEFKKNSPYGVKEGIYAIPIDMMSIQFLMNKKMLKEIGGETPSTWQEFIELAKKAKEKGKWGFICGWGESWFIYCLVTNYAFNIMGKEKFFSTLKGEVPYTDPDWIKVFKLFKELKEADVLFPGIVTLSNKEAEQFFAQEKALFSFNGSWGINTYFQINPDLEYDTLPPPQVNKNFPVAIWAGAGSSFVVNKNSPLKKEAIDFLKWFTQKEQQIFLIQHTHNLPAIKGCEDKLDKNLVKFLKNLEYATHPRIWPINENPRVVEAINTGVQKILVGEAEPEEVAKEIEEVKREVVKEK